MGKYFGIDGLTSGSELFKKLTAAVWTFGDALHIYTFADKRAATRTIKPTFYSSLKSEPLWLGAAIWDFAGSSIRDISN